MLGELTRSAVGCQLALLLWRRRVPQSAVTKRVQKSLDEFGYRSTAFGELLRETRDVLGTVHRTVTSVDVAWWEHARSVQSRLLPPDPHVLDSLRSMLRSQVDRVQEAWLAAFAAWEKAEDTAEA